MSEFILRAEGVTKDYVAARGLLGQPTRLVRAVKGVSLAVAPGTTLALVGESGSGKSTLGRCIAGLLRPTSGRIELAGHDVRHLAGGRLMAFRRQVQTIFQDPYSSLNPRRRVGDAIMDGMVIHKLYSPDERRDRMQALLARVGLRPEHAQRFPHQFSDGREAGNGLEVVGAVAGRQGLARDLRVGRDGQRRARGDAGDHHRIGGGDGVGAGGLRPGGKRRGQGAGQAGRPQDVLVLVHVSLWV